MNSRKTRITFVCAICAFSFLTGVSSAQPMRRGLPDSTQIATMVEELSQKLSLADSVETKVNKFYFASFAELKKQIENTDGDFRAMFEARQKTVQVRDKEIMALLTDEQKKKFEKIIAEEQERRRNRRRGRPNNN